MYSNGWACNHSQALSAFHLFQTTCEHSTTRNIKYYIYLKNFPLNIILWWSGPQCKNLAKCQTQGTGGSQKFFGPGGLNGYKIHEYMGRRCTIRPTTISTILNHKTLVQRSSKSILHVQIKVPSRTSGTFSYEITHYSFLTCEAQNPKLSVL